MCVVSVRWLLGLILAKKKLQYLGSICDNPEILGNEVLPKKVFREELASISAGTLCLAPV